MESCFRFKSISTVSLPANLHLLNHRTYADNPEDTSQLQLYFDNHYDPMMPTSAYPTTPTSPIIPQYAPKHLHSQIWREQTISRKRSISDTAVPFRGLKLSVCIIRKPSNKLAISSSYDIS